VFFLLYSKITPRLPLSCFPDITPDLSLNDVYYHQYISYINSEKA